MKTRILIIAIMLLTLTGCTTVKIYPNGIIGSRWSCHEGTTTHTFTVEYYSQYEDGTTYIGYKEDGLTKSHNGLNCEPQ